MTTAKTSADTGATVVNNLQAMISRVAGRKINVTVAGEDPGENGIDAEALVGLALIDPDFGPATAAGNAAATRYIALVSNARERTTLEREKERIGKFAELEWKDGDGTDGEAMPPDAVDALALARFRRLRKSQEFGGVHIGVRRVLARAVDGLSRSRRMLLRFLNRNLISDEATR